MRAGTTALALTLAASALAGWALAIQNGDGLRYRPFKEAIYSVGHRQFNDVTEEFDLGYSGVPEPIPLMVLSYVGPGQDDSSGIYSLSYPTFAYDLTATPDFDRRSKRVELRPTGWVQVLAGSPETGTAMYDNLLMTSPPVFPVFGAEAEDIREGSAWKSNVRPVAYNPGHISAPPRQHCVLEQEWTDTVELRGKRCARISYRLTDHWKDELEEATFRFELRGVAYFALDEGIVVLNTLHIDVSVEQEQERQRFGLQSSAILVHYEPLAPD